MNKVKGCQVDGQETELCKGGGKMSRPRDLCGCGENDKLTISERCTECSHAMVAAMLRGGAKAEEKEFGFENGGRQFDTHFNYARSQELLKKPLRAIS